MQQRQFRWRHIDPPWLHEFREDEVPKVEPRLDPEAYDIIEHIRATGQLGSGARIDPDFNPASTHDRLFINKDRETAQAINAQLRAANPNIGREPARYERQLDREALEAIKARAAERKKATAERKRRQQQRFFELKRQAAEYNTKIAQLREQQRLQEQEWLAATRKVIEFRYDSFEHLVLCIAQWPGIPSADAAVEIAEKMIEACDRDKTVLDQVFVRNWMDYQVFVNAAQTQRA